VLLQQNVVQNDFLDQNGIIFFHGIGKLAKLMNYLKKKSKNFKNIQNSDI